MYRDPYFDAPGISSHKLADFRRRGPAYYRRKHIEMVIPDEDSAALSFGRAFHTLTLEGEAKFSRLYIEAPAEHLTPGGSLSDKKATREWLATQTCAALSAGDMFSLRQMSRAVRGHAEAARLLSTGRAEVERFETHAETGLALKGKADWITGNQLGIDLKSCWNVDEFPADALKYGYAEQAAFYVELFHLIGFYLIACEKQEPYRVRVYRISDHSLIAASRTNRAALIELARCYETGDWNDPASVIELCLHSPTA